MAHRLKARAKRPLLHAYTLANDNLRTGPVDANYPFETHHALAMDRYTYNLIGELQEEAEAVIGGRRVEVCGMPGGDGRFYCTFACAGENDMELLREWFGDRS